MIIPIGFAQANFVFSGAAAPTGAQCTLGLDVSVLALDDDVFGQSLANAWQTNILTKQVDDIVLDEVRVKFGPTATGRTIIAPVGAQGNVAGVGEVPNSALLVNKQTNQGGRAGRGRMFIPGLEGNSFDGSGVLNPAQLVVWQSDLDSFHDDITAMNVTPVLLHGDDAPLSGGTPITRFLVQSRAATQRRRLRR